MRELIPAVEARYRGIGEGWPAASSAAQPAGGRRSRRRCCTQTTSTTPPSPAPIRSPSRRIPPSTCTRIRMRTTTTRRSRRRRGPAIATTTWDGRRAGHVDGHVRLAQRPDDGHGGRDEPPRGRPRPAERELRPVGHLGGRLRPRGADGYPARVWCKDPTKGCDYGAINTTVAHYWRDHRPWASSAASGARGSARSSRASCTSSSAVVTPSSSTNAVMDFQDWVTSPEVQPPFDGEIVVGTHGGRGYEHCFNGYLPDGNWPRPTGLQARASTCRSFCRGWRRGERRRRRPARAWSGNEYQSKSPPSNVSAASPASDPSVVDGADPQSVARLPRRSTR